MKTIAQTKLYFGGISAPRNAAYPFPKNSILERLETKLGNPWLPWYFIMPERMAAGQSHPVPNLGGEPEELAPGGRAADSGNHAPGHLMLIEVSALFSPEDWMEIAKFRRLLSSGCETLFLCRNSSAEDAAPPQTWHGAGYREDRIFLMDDLIIRSLKFPDAMEAPLPAAKEHAPNRIPELDR